MWRYLTLNTLWFAMLFLVQSCGSQKSRDVIFWTLAAAGLWLLRAPEVDPFAWAAYFAYSLLVFSGAARFRQWVTARRKALEEERDILTRKLEAEHAWLRRAQEETDQIAGQSEEVTYLCDKLKDMSQTLTKLEAFLVFGEALSKNFKFDCLKLILFKPDAPAGLLSEPEEVYQLLYSDFEGIFDRSRMLKDPQTARGRLFQFDRRVLESIGHEAAGSGSASPKGHREPMGFDEETAPFMAYPVRAQDDDIFGALILIGVDAKDFQVFSILTKSFMAELKRIHLFERVQNLAVTDGLTQVAVRRHFNARLDVELERSSRMGLKLSFLMLDIDDFKHFNDRCGHLVGDVVLKEVADTIKKNIREVDLVGRFGGEEFAVFLTETDESGAFFVAERIRRAVAERTFRAYGENLKVTVSIGCSTFVPSSNAPERVVETADAALFEAKRLGKNRVHVSSVDKA